MISITRRRALKIASTQPPELEDLLSRYQKRVGFFIEHLIAWRPIHVSVLFVGCDHGGEAVCLRSLYPNVDVIGSHQIAASKHA